VLSPFKLSYVHNSRSGCRCTSSDFCENTSWRHS